MNLNLHSFATDIPATHVCVVRFSIVGKSRYGLLKHGHESSASLYGLPALFKVSHWTQCLRSRPTNNVRQQNFAYFFFCTSNFRRKCFKISCNAFKRPLDDVTSKFRHFIAIKHLVMQWKKKKGKEKRSKLQKIVALFTLYKGTNCLIN